MYLHCRTTPDPGVQIRGTVLPENKARSQITTLTVRVLRRIKFGEKLLAGINAVT